MSSLPTSPQGGPDPLRPRIALDPAGIPADLKAIPNWVCWRYQVTPKGATKVPFAAATGKRASTTDASTWATFDAALAACGQGGYAGVGFVLAGGGGLTGVDLDGCIREDGTVAPEARAIIDQLATYTELSPSGGGVKLILRGTKPEWAKCKTANVEGFERAEVYNHERFFTITGRPLEGTPAIIAERQSALEAFCASLWPQKPEPPDGPGPRGPSGFTGDDDELIERAGRAKNGEKFRRLWSGDISGHNNDDSAADQALCNILAFWTGGDAGRMDRLFRRSGLYREKWERENYREPTIAHAIETCRDTYTGERPRPAGSLPVVLIEPDEHRVIDEVCQALGSDNNLYQRGGILVRVVRDAVPDDGIRREAGTPTIAELPQPTLREWVTRNCELIKETEEGPKHVHPSGWLVGGVSARRSWPTVRVLSGVSDVPVLRPDGSIWQSPGYDPVTGIIYNPGGDVPAIPPSPTLDDAWAAVESLLEIVCDFRFQSDMHRAAWLAGLLTPLARAAFSGPAPCFLIDANIRGAGKGLLAHSIGYVVLGRSMPISAYTVDDDELRKRITALVIAGDPVVLLDNLDGKFGNPALDAALTGTHWSDRLLGRNQMVKLPLTATWYATGNNVQVAADTARRIVYIRLEVMEERPEDRSDFRHPRLREWVLEHRERLVASALTVLSAYCRAGRPDQGLTPMGSFEGWSDLVRSAVVWSGQADPCASRKELAETSDTTREALDQFMLAMTGYLTEDAGFVVSELIGNLYPAHREPPMDPGSVAVRAALEALTPGGREPTAKVVGAKLRHFRRRVVGGRYIDNDPKEKCAGGAVWRIKSANGTLPA